MSPRRKYLNPPLIETIFEAVIPQEESWDLTIPGLFWEKVKQQGYSIRKNRTHKEYRIQDHTDSVPQVRIHERAVFLTEDKKNLMQVGDRMLAVNRLHPYSSWEDFKPRIDLACSAIQEVIATLKAAERLVLRYVNQIRIPKAGFTLEEFFNFRPFLGGGFPMVPQSLITGCVFPLNENRDQCKLELVSTNTKNPDEVAFFLALEFFSVPGIGRSWSEVKPWVETAHSEIEKLFELCLTPSLREIFGEIEE
jgi:uncharacterized protein (TIGR04255 family)